MTRRRPLFAVILLALGACATTPAERDQRLAVLQSVDAAAFTAAEIYIATAGAPPQAVLAVRVAHDAATAALAEYRAAPGDDAKAASAQAAAAALARVLADINSAPAPPAR